MFGWLKSKQENPNERYRKIATSFQALESGLKAAESHWLAGNTAEGDKLFAAINQACLDNFLGGPKNKPDDIRLLQFEGLKQFIRFLERHSKLTELNDLILKLPEHINDFNQEQMSFLIHMMDVAKEAQQSKANVADKKLAYYVCQACGHLILTLTTPCLYCGFSCKNEVMVRRGLFLSSGVLNTSVLMHVASALLAGRNSSPPKTLQQVWSTGDIDDAARQGTYEFEPVVADLLQKSLSRAQTFNGPPKISVKCLECGKVMPVFTDRSVQKCPDCGAVVPIPTLRRIKATLDHSLYLTTLFADHVDTVAYSNFIASWVLLNEYALRKDAPPTKAQGLDLIQRFAAIAPVSYMDGKAHLKYDSESVVPIFRRENPLAEDGKPFIAQQSNMMNILFRLFRSDEMNI